MFVLDAKLEGRLNTKKPARIVVTGVNPEAPTTLIIKQETVPGLDIRRALPTAHLLAYQQAQSVDDWQTPGVYPFTTPYNDELSTAWCLVLPTATNPILPPEFYPDYGRIEATGRWLKPQELEELEERLQEAGWARARDAGPEETPYLVTPGNWDGSKIRTPPLTPAEFARFSEDDLARKVVHTHRLVLGDYPTKKKASQVSRASIEPAIHHHVQNILGRRLTRKQALQYAKPNVIEQARGTPGRISQRYAIRIIGYHQPLQTLHERIKNEPRLQATLRGESSDPFMVFEPRNDFKIKSAGPTNQALVIRSLFPPGTIIDENKPLLPQATLPGTKPRTTPEERAEAHRTVQRMIDSGVLSYGYDIETTDYPKRRDLIEGQVITEGYAGKDERVIYVTREVPLTNGRLRSNPKTRVYILPNELRMRIQAEQEYPAIKWGHNSQGFDLPVRKNVDKLPPIRRFANDILAAYRAGDLTRSDAKILIKNFRRRMQERHDEKIDRKQKTVNPYAEEPDTMLFWKSWSLDSTVNVKLDMLSMTYDEQKTDGYGDIDVRWDKGPLYVEKNLDYLDGDLDFQSDLVANMKRPAAVGWRGFNRSPTRLTNNTPIAAADEKRLIDHIHAFSPDWEHRPWADGLLCPRDAREGYRVIVQTLFSGVGTPRFHQNLFVGVPDAFISSTMPSTRQYPVFSDLEGYLRTARDPRERELLVGELLGLHAALFDEIVHDWECLQKHHHKLGTMLAVDQYYPERTQIDAGTPWRSIPRLRREQGLIENLRLETPGTWSTNPEYGPQALWHYSNELLTQLQTTPRAHVHTVTTSGLLVTTSEEGLYTIHKGPGAILNENQALIWGERPLGPGVKLSSIKGADAPRKYPVLDLLQQAVNEGITPTVLAKAEKLSEQPPDRQEKVCKALYQALRNTPQE